MDKPSLTLIAPSYNEAGNIGPLVREAAEKLRPHLDVHIIVIDDESEDDTQTELADVKADVPELTVLRHPKRSGKSAALRTGILAAQSLWIATIDGDGQNDPADILEMAKEIDLNAVGDVGLVGGVRKLRNDGASRKWASRLANGLRRNLLKDDCPDTGCGLKLMPRDVFLALPFFDSMHRYFPPLIRHLGFEGRYVKVDDRPRVAGVSKYSNIGRAIAGFFDLMGVLWLMRRTSVPDKSMLFRSGQK